MASAWAGSVGGCVGGCVAAWRSIHTHTGCCGAKVPKAILIKARSVQRLRWAAPPLGPEGLRLYGLGAATAFRSRDLSRQLPSGLSPGVRQQVLGGSLTLPFLWCGTGQEMFIWLTLPSHHWNFAVLFSLFKLIFLKSASSHKFKDVLCSRCPAQNIRGPFYSLWLHAVSPCLGNCWGVSQKDVLIN